MGGVGGGGGGGAGSVRGGEERGNGASNGYSRRRDERPKVERPVEARGRVWLRLPKGFFGRTHDD